MVRGEDRNFVEGVGGGALGEGWLGAGWRIWVLLAIVQPGIINTDMAKAVTIEADTTVYPHSRRFAGLFKASLKTPTNPELVGNRIREIVESDSPQLRYPVGPDAEPFLAWRASMNDEQWVDWAATDDESWYASVERDFGLDARKGI